MSAHVEPPALCSFCEGPRDVRTYVVLDVELLLCRWCWELYGPARIPQRLGQLFGAEL